ncbi:MAG: tripartite tricarboxylate transporter substrate-binding protein, partial [Pseudomonadota bacterium]
YTIGSFVIGVPVIGHKIEIPELTPEKFDPLGIFLTYPFVLAAAGDAPYSTMEELAEYAKSEDVALGHFGAPLAPTRVSLAYAKTARFEWGSEAAFDMLDCNTLASGDADVINTTLQLILPCLDQVTVLASVTDSRIASMPQVPTMGELAPDLNLGLWNGLFVNKDTPADVREKIIAVAKKTMMSDRAQKVAADTGALVYWQDAEASAARVAADGETLAKINGMLAE